MKRCPADDAFSEYIRRRDGYCLICGASGEPNASGHYIKGLECSHFHKRRHEGTRFDPKNADTFCTSHHAKFEKNQGLYSVWKNKQIGDKEYNKLAGRRAGYKKKDRKAALVYARELLKTLGD